MYIYCVEISETKEVVVIMEYGSIWKSSFRFVDAERKNYRVIYFSILIGALVGLMGSIFRLSISYIEDLRATLLSDADFADLMSWIKPLLLIMGSALLSIFAVKKFAPEASGSGVQEIEGALDDMRPLRWKKVIPVKFFGSLLSLGSGFLLGREGPTIQVGANIGGMVRDIFKQNKSWSNPLVSAGAAAGLAAAFNAPFSGIIFVMEEMHDHFKYSFFSLAGIMAASATADLVVRFIIGEHPIIEMMVFRAPELSLIWMFVVLGALFAVIGLIFNKFLVFTLKLFKVLPRFLNIVVILVVSAGIAIVGIIDPAMIGGGYETVGMTLNHSFTLQMLFVIFLVRMLLTVFSYGIGLPGGIFAPMLALGVVFGMFFGGVMTNYFPDLVEHQGVFAVAGMAAIFASTVRAPITGMILAVEMTSNYQLILPLLFTVLTASLFTTLFGNKPIYTVLLELTIQNEEQKAIKQDD